MPHQMVWLVVCTRVFEYSLIDSISLNSKSFIFWPFLFTFSITTTSFIEIKNANLRPLSVAQDNGLESVSIFEKSILITVKCVVISELMCHYILIILRLVGRGLLDRFKLLFTHPHPLLLFIADFSTITHAHSFNPWFKLSKWNGCAPQLISTVKSASNQYGFHTYFCILTGTLITT